MLSYLQAGHDGLLDAFFPRRCCMCGKVGSWLCGCCELAHVQDGELHEERLPNGGRLCWAFPYRCEPVRSLIHLMKYGGVADIAETLVRMIARRNSGLAERFETSLWLPVPSSKRHLRERGYNQAEEIARSWSRVLGGSMCPPVLEHMGGAVQAGSSAAARKEQAAHAFRWIARSPLQLSGRSLVVVDDVCTTGSTLSACLSQLRMRLGVEASGLVIARET